MTTQVAQLIQPTPGPFFATLALYFIILAGIGWYAARNTHNLKDFFVLGGKAGAVVSGIAYFATQYSMSTFMGVPAVAYANGYAGLTISVPGLAFSMIIPALLVGRKLMQLSHRFGLLTMTDYLADRYDSRKLGVLHAVMMVAFLIGMIGAQTVGAGVIVHTFTGLPEWVGVVGMGIIVILYCMTGGMKGAMLTDVLQGGLMVTTAVVTFAVSVHAGGGLSEINAALLAKGEQFLSHPGAAGKYPWTAYVSMIVMWSFFTIGQPTLFTKFYAMRDYRTMFKAVILGTLGMLLAATMIEWSGVMGIVSLPGLTGKETDFIVPMLLQQNLNPYVAAILIAGIVSAGMSTIDALLVVATGGICRDIYQHGINPQATDEQVFRLSRIVTVLIGIAGIIVGIMKPASIFELIRFSFGGLGIWVAPVLLGMYWKRASLKAAFISVIIGEALYVSTALWGQGLTFGFDPLIPTWTLTVVLMVVISLFDKPVDASVLERHFGKDAGSRPDTLPEPARA